MTKKDFIDLLQCGASVKVDALIFTISELVNCAKAAKRGGGKLYIIHADCLSLDEMKILCAHAPGHIHFPDLELKGILL